MCTGANALQGASVRAISKPSSPTNKPRQNPVADRPLPTMLDRARTRRRLRCRGAQLGNFGELDHLPILAILTRVSSVQQGFDLRVDAGHQHKDADAVADDAPDHYWTCAMSSFAEGSAASSSSDTAFRKRLYKSMP